MEIQIIFDKDSVDSSLETGWGLSVLIDGCILFDTGEKGTWLMDNMEYLKVAPESLQAVVISHDHWDHTGGLWTLLERKKGGDVYACPGFSREFKDKVRRYRGRLIELDGFSRIAENVFVTGEITGQYSGHDIAEQSVVIKTGRGLSVLTGCSHPGIVRILEAVRAQFPEEKMYLVAGGFHLMGSGALKVRAIAEKIKRMGVEKAGPTHCTGAEARVIFKEVFGTDFIEIKAGQTIEI